MKRCKIYKAKITWLLFIWYARLFKCWLSVSFFHNITLSAIFPLLVQTSRGYYPLGHYSWCCMKQQPAAKPTGHPSAPTPIIHFAWEVWPYGSTLSLVPSHNNRLQLSRGSSHHCLAIYLSVRVVIIYGPRQVTVVRLWTWRFQQGCSITRRFSLTCTECTADALLSSGANPNCFFLCVC